MPDADAAMPEAAARRRCLRLIFWAFLFFLPFRWPLAGGALMLQALPDAAGWLLVLIGLGLVRRLDGRFERPRLPALAGLLIALPRTVQYHEHMAPWLHVYYALTVAAAAAAGLFVWRLCALVRELAEEADDAPLAEAARLRRSLYLACLAAPFLGLLMKASRLPPVGALVAAWLTLVLSVCAVTLMMDLMQKAWHVSVRHRAA
jgi:hypothetical protein